MTKEITLGNFGAVNALKGYRIQALYSICTILGNPSKELTYIPEGIEDLDINDNTGQLLELHQVKNTSNTLTLSNLFSKNKTSFFGRAIDIFEQGKRPQLKVICFGELGVDLKKLFSTEVDQQSFNNRLTTYEATEEQLQFIKENTTLESVEEAYFQMRAVNLIRQKAIGVNPEIAIDYLHFWLYYLSEKGGQITHESLLAKLNDIGQFVDERQNFHKHLHTSIRSINSTGVSEDQLEILSESFYEGVSANYQHVLANLDVVREDKIDQILELFSETNVAIIHGASGQGKSTLAFRYVSLFHSILAYELVPLENIQSTLEQIQALKAFSKSLEIPILLYIDVQPGNQNWTQILSEFAYSKVFKFIITIREEDWNRTNDKGVTFPFKDLELGLDKYEAEQIYNALNQKITDFNFTDFEEAWVSFGGKGPLLEFTYLITQGKTLKSRIESQLNRIERDTPEFIPILKIVSQADYLGAKINLDRLKEAEIVEKLRLSIVTLEKEFLLKLSDDENWLTGLHPVRSRVIAEVLHFSEKDTESTVLNTIQLIDENKLFIFLINSFILLPKSRRRLIQRLSEKSWNSFMALKEITNALIWIGLKSFVENHRDLLNEWYPEDKLFLGATAYFNFTSTVDLKDMFSFNQQYINKLLKHGETLKSLHITKDSLLQPLTEWLTQVKLPKYELVAQNDAAAFGEFLFWLGHQSIERIIDCDGLHISEAISNSPIEVASKIMLGLHQYNDTTRKLAFECEKNFLTNLKKNYEISLIERTETTIKAYFFIDIYDEEFETRENFIHYRKLQILDGLRYGLPYLQKHACQGYGQKSHFLPDNWDQSTANVSIKNQPVPYLVKLNAILLNLFTYQYRPADWVEFADNVIILRSSLVKYFQLMVTAFDEYYRKRKNSVLVRDFAIENFSKQDFEYKIAFPKSISDPSGLVSEGNSKDEPSQEIVTQSETTSILNTKFEAYRKVHGDFFGGLHTFNWQSIKVILDHYGLSQEKEPHLKRVSLVNIIDAYKNLSSYQTTFREHFEKYTNIEHLDRIETEEKELVSSLLYCWKHFVRPSNLYKKAARKEATKTFDKVKTDFEKRVSRACEKARSNSGYAMEFNAHFELVPKVVIITVDFIDILRLGDGLELAILAIKEAISPSKVLSFKHTMLETHYPIFWIIPTIMDKVFQFSAFKLRLHQFMQELDIEQIPVSKEVENFELALVEKMGLMEFNDNYGKIKEAQEFLGKFHELLLNVGVLCQLIEVGEKDGHNDEEEEIWRRQFKSVNDKVNDILNDYANGWFKEFSFLIELNEKEELTDFDLEYFHILQDIREQTWPAQNEENELEFSGSLQQEEILRWRERLLGQEESILFVYIIMINRATEYKGFSTEEG